MRAGVFLRNAESTSNASVITRVFELAEKSFRSGRLCAFCQNRAVIPDVYLIDGTFLSACIRDFHFPGTLPAGEEGRKWKFALIKMRVGFDFRDTARLERWDELFIKRILATLREKSLKFGGQNV